MKPHSINPDFPLNPTVITILRAVAEETALAGIHTMIVGATARDILLTHIFCIPPRRATYDVDFAVGVKDWEQFERLKSQLAAREGFDTSDRMPHRLYFNGRTKEDGYPIDLVPFGELAHDKNEVVWPPDMQVTMNVAGYDEVLAAAVQVEVTQGLIARVASLPGLAILKLVAWSDRGTTNPKDAHDLYQIMTRYAEAGNSDRLYNLEFPMLEAANYDPEIAGASLLGKDASLLSSDETHRILMAILERDYARIAIEMVKSIRHDEDAETKVDVRLRHFKAGMLMR